MSFVFILYVYLVVVYRIEYGIGKSSSCVEVIKRKHPDHQFEGQELRKIMRSIETEKIGMHCNDVNRQMQLLMLKSIHSNRPISAGIKILPSY